MATATKIAHTPGPWTATCDDDSTEEANAIYAGGICIARLTGEDEIRLRNYPGEVEPVGCTASTDALDEVDANARLIAASPDLLAVARLTLKTLVAWKKTDGEWALLQKQLRAAIRKAENVSG